MYRPNEAPVECERRTPRHLAAGVAALLALVLAGCAAPAPAAAPVPVAGSWQAEMLASLNAQRSAAGVGPLTACPTLEVAAQRHSADQAARSTMSHTGSDGSSPWDRMARAGYRNYTAAAENVAGGQRGVGQVMSAWMGSSGHRANILNGAYTHVGVGQAISAGGRAYWTQDFGRGGTC